MYFLFHYTSSSLLTDKLFEIILVLFGIICFPVFISIMSLFFIFSSHFRIKTMNWKLSYTQIK